MNTTELINEVARRSRRSDRVFSRTDVEHMMGILLDVMREQLTRPDGQIVIPNFGILEVDQRIRKKGKSGELMTPDGKKRDVSRVSYHIRFRPAQHLKDTLKARRIGWKYRE